jgi:hypothetical protein
MMRRGPGTMQRPGMPQGPGMMQRPGMQQRPGMMQRPGMQPPGVEQRRPPIGRGPGPMRMRRGMGPQGRGAVVPPDSGGVRGRVQDGR